MKAAEAKVMRRNGVPKGMGLSNVSALLRGRVKREKAGKAARRTLDTGMAGR